MLWTIFVVLLVMWALGVVSSYTLGGFIHLLLLIAIAGLSHADAAAVCGVSPEALRQRLSRARAQLARAIEAVGPATAAVLGEVTP